jgi:hypothetical protein
VSFCVSVVCFGSDIKALVILNILRYHTSRDLINSSRGEGQNEILLITLW